jgi:hypothetical protein
VLEPFIDFERDDIVWTRDPFVEPHTQAGVPEALGKPADQGLVLRVVAQKDVESELTIGVRHWD